MERVRIRRGVRLGLLSMILGSSVLAQTPTPTPTTCCGTTILNGADPTVDYQYNPAACSSPCLIMNGSGTSNFGEHRVICPEGSTCPTAILFSNSLSGPSTVSHVVIEGRWAIGIDGSSAPGGERTTATASRVKGATSAIKNVDVIEGNVISAGLDESQYGIEWAPNEDLSTGVANQVVQDNMINLRNPVAAIYVVSAVSGEADPKIRRNLIMTDAMESVSADASGEVLFENNLFAWGALDSLPLSGPAFTFSGAVATSGNLCDALIESVDTDSVCTDMPIPFSLP